MKEKPQLTWLYSPAASMLCIMLTVTLPCSDPAPPLLLPLMSRDCNDGVTDDVRGVDDHVLLLAPHCTWNIQRSLQFSDYTFCDFVVYYFPTH